MQVLLFIQKEKYMTDAILQAALYKRTLPLYVRLYVFVDYMLLFEY